MFLLNDLMETPLKFEVNKIIYKKWDNIEKLIFVLFKVQILKHKLKSLFI